MPNRLEIPAELDALIEKRDQDDRRENNETPADDASANAQAQSKDEERRSGEDRRQSPDEAT